MSNVFPSKELIEMVESRIWGGRLLTTTALFLALLAIIVGSVIYLYRSVIAPTITLVLSGVTTGRVNPAAFSGFIGSLLGAVVLTLISRWLQRKLMDQVQRVMALYDKTSKTMDVIIEAEQVASKNVALLVKRVDILEKTMQSVSQKLAPER